MDKKVLRRLEFHKVLEQLASYAVSPLGKERVMELEPVDDLGTIIRWQKETTEGRELMRLDPAAEFGGWKDVRVQIKRAQRGALLEPEELTAVADTLTAGRLLKNFLQERQERYAGFPAGSGKRDQEVDPARRRGGGHGVLRAGPVAA